jgi:UDP-glucuronate 4-epimerase
MAHYLVPGAAGFIGSHVIKDLLDAGHHVTGIDNLNDAYDVRMKEYRLRQLNDQAGFTFLKLDIADRNVLNPGTFGTQNANGVRHGTVIPTIDAVINLAARAGVRQSIDNPWVYIDSNVTGTLNLLELCRQMGIPKFILASTSSIYGANAPLPTPETADSSYPLQTYAASKKAAETLAYTYHHLYDIDVTVFRYFTVYGPAGRPDMSMFRFTQWINEGLPVRLNGDGEQSRGFTYVGDIARGTILGLKPLGYEIINLGGHETIKMNELIYMVEELTGRKAQIQHFPANPSEMLANWANIDKAKRLLGWEPTVGLVEGVARLVHWYNTERAWTSQIITTD